MLDTRQPVDLAPLPAGVEDEGYASSWTPRR
jgi:hypothetical protein